MTETGDGQATDGGESPKEDMPAPPAPEPEPEEVGTMKSGPDIPYGDPE